MSGRCTICRHPQHEAITVSVMRNGLRSTARTFQVSLPALYRHKGHTSRTMVKAEQAQEIINATSLLARVENLIVDCQNIAARAQAAGQWSQATGALREVRGCLELLAKLESELRRASERAQPASSVEKMTDAELQLLEAGFLYEATKGFDPTELVKLKALVEDEIKRTGVAPAEVSRRLCRAAHLY